MLHAGNKLPLIRQSETTECGLACLAMILGYFGYKTDISVLRRQFPASSHGQTLKNLVTLAGQVKLVARPLQVEIDELPKLQLPAILHWDMSHYVVLHRIKNKNYEIFNPARGVLIIGHDEIDRHFTGIAVEFSPGCDFEKGNDVKKLGFITVLKQAHGITDVLLQLFVLSLLMQVFSLALPFYSQIFLDEVMVTRDSDLLIVIASGFLLITIIKCITEYVRSLVVIHLGNKISFQFASSLCQHLLKLPLEYFNKRHLGDIVSRFSSLQKIKDFICSGMIEILIDGLMVISTLVLMFVYSRILALIALLAVIVYVLLRVLLFNSFKARSEELLVAAAQENTSFMENIRGIQGIKLFGQEGHSLLQWQNSYIDVINAGVRVQSLGVTVRFLHGLLVGVENIVLMLIGGYAVLNNTISIGMLIAFISFKDQFYTRIFALFDKVFEFRLLDVHLERLADIFYTHKEKHMQGIGLPPPDVCLQGGLVLKAIRFQYTPDTTPVLAGLDLHIENNESVAITGASGCGKSTLAKIVMSLLLPDAGQVSLFNMPVQKMGLEAYRSRIAGVLQDDTLLNGTIIDNITMFDPEPDLEQVEMVCNLAAIAREIRVMPMQYYTPVGSLDANLSGGQVQRILLARALYKKPRLLVLDEATSHLDTDIEKAVNIAIKQLRIARLIVAHRPQTIMQADRILKLDNGKLLSVGHHEFAKMVAN